MSEKYILLRLSTAVDEALKAAAYKRQMNKVRLIESLLTMVVHDELIDAVLDDNVGSGAWNTKERTRRLAT